MRSMFVLLKLLLLTEFAAVCFAEDVVPSTIFTLDASCTAANVAFLETYMDETALVLEW
jgi:hypothetical protein